MYDGKISLDKKKDERNDENSGCEFVFDFKNTDDTNRQFCPENINYPTINLNAYSEHSLLSQIMTDGLGNLLSTLGKQLFEFLKEKITARYGKIAVVAHFLYKARAIFLSDINTFDSGNNSFDTLINDPEFSSFFSNEPQFQGLRINNHLLLLIRLIIIWNDLKHIRKQPVKVLSLALPQIIHLLREDQIITAWNRTQATEWASVINAALPWINFYAQQTTKPSTSIGNIISSLYQDRQDLLPGWLNQLVDTVENLFREVKHVLSKMGSYLSDYNNLIVIADKINNGHTFGERVSNVIYFFTQYDEEKAKLFNKIKSDLSPEIQRFLSEWQAVHEINTWFRAEVGGSPDPVTALKALETLTDPKKIAMLRAKTAGTQSEKWLAAYQTSSSEWFQSDSAISVTLRTAIRLFRKDLSWREFLLMTAGEINAQNLIWKAVTAGRGLLLAGKGGNAEKLSRLAVLVKQYHEGTSLADLLQQDMQLALEGKSLLVDLASVMTGIDLSQYLEKQQWVQDAVKAISEWHLSHDHDQLLIQLSQLTTKQESNAWWIAGILLKGIILFRLWQNYQHRDANTNLKKTLLKLMPNIPENWLPWVLELCDWLPVLIQISHRREQLTPLSVDQNWLSWSRQIMAEAGLDEDLLLKKIMSYIGGYQQHWLMNLLKVAGFKNFAGLSATVPRSAGQPSADVMWGALATAATQGRNISHWVNQTVGSAKRVALPLGTLIFIDQIVQAHASSNILSALSNSGNSTSPSQEEMPGVSSGYLSLLPALAVAGGSGLYHHLGRYFNSTSTDSIPTDPELQGKYTFDAELQEVNARLKDSGESWLPAALLGGGLAAMLGGATWAAHTRNQTSQPEQKVDETEMLTISSKAALSYDAEAHNDELSALSGSEQEPESEDEQQGISTRGSSRNKYLLSGFIAGAGVVSAITSGILYLHHQWDAQRKTDLENIIEFNEFDNSEFTARVAKKLVELVGENFVTQAKYYDVRLAVEEVLLDGGKTEKLPKSTTLKPRLVKRSLPGEVVGNSVQSSNITQVSTKLSNDPLFIAALRNQLQTTENDIGSGLRNYQRFEKYSGWKFGIGHNLNKKAVGTLRALEYNKFPDGYFFILKLTGANNEVLYEKHYRPDDDNNTPDKYRKNLFDKINSDIEKSHLEIKNKVRIIAVSSGTYFTEIPVAMNHPDNSMRNFFVASENSAVRSADWSIVTRHRKILFDKVKENSPWIRKTLQQKNDQYIRENYIAQESLKVDHTIGAPQYAQSVINKIHDGISHSSGAYIDDFKAEISNLVGSVCLSEYSDEDEYYELLDEKVTYSYYLIDIFDNKSNTYKSVKKTVTETFWDFLLKRRDFFNKTESYVDSGGKKTNAIRSGTPIGRTIEIPTFEFERFHNEVIPDKVKTLFNDDSYLRREGEKYINKAFKDDKFRIYNNLLMDIYLANSLDKVIAKNYVDGLSISANRKIQYANFAKQIRTGKYDVDLLQHKNSANKRETADRLILIPANEDDYYLAVSIGAGQTLQMEIKLDRYEDGYRVNDNAIDFLKNFFPEDSLSKFRLINPKLNSTQVGAQIPRQPYTYAWDKFYIHKSSNPLEDLMAAHKHNRLDMIAYIFESQKELDAKRRKRIYDDLLTAFTLLTFAIPAFEPLAVEMLALRGASVEIVNGIANVTVRVLNVSSLGLGVMSSWEDYQSKKSRPKEAMEAWSSFIDTLSINLLIASTEFFPGMPLEDRYEKAVQQVEEDAAIFEISQIIKKCKGQRSPGCIEGANKVAEMAELFAKGNKHPGVDRSVPLNFVLDICKKSKMIDDKLYSILKSATGEEKLSNYLGVDPLRITSKDMLSEIPKGARLAFTDISTTGVEQIKYVMISVGRKMAIGVKDNWLTMRGTTNKKSLISKIDLESDIIWAEDGSPVNMEYEPISIYSQSLKDLERSEPVISTGKTKATKSNKTEFPSGISLNEATRLANANGLILINRGNAKSQIFYHSAIEPTINHSILPKEVGTSTVFYRAMDENEFNALKPSISGASSGTVMNNFAKLDPLGYIGITPNENYAYQIFSRNKSNQHYLIKFDLNGKTLKDILEGETSDFKPEGYGSSFGLGERGTNYLPGTAATGRPGDHFFNAIKNGEISVSLIGVKSCTD